MHRYKSSENYPVSYLIHQLIVSAPLKHHCIFALGHSTLQFRCRFNREIFDTRGVINSRLVVDPPGEMCAQIALSWVVQVYSVILRRLADQSFPHLLGGVKLD